MSKKKTIKAPLTHNPGKGRPKEHLAYLNWQEMEALKRLNGNNMERGPKGLPSFAFAGPSSSLSAPARTAPSTGAVKSTSTPRGNTGSYPSRGTVTTPSKSTTTSSRVATSSNRDIGVAGVPGGVSRTGASLAPRATSSGAAGTTSSNRDTVVRQAVANDQARSATTNRSLQQDTSKSGVRSINVGPMGTPVNLPRTTTSTRAAGNISRIAEQAKYPSRGATFEPPKATTDITAMTISAKKAIGTPATNPNYSRDYAKIMADRDAQIRRMTAPTPKAPETVSAGGAYVNPDMPESVKRALAARGYNPDGTKIQGSTPAQMAVMYSNYRSPPPVPQFAGRPRPTVAAPPPAIDPSIAGRLAEANRNYKAVSSGPYVSRVYSDPDLAPGFSETAANYVRGLYDSASSGIGRLFGGSASDIPEAMRTPLDQLKVPGLTYEQPSVPFSQYWDGLRPGMSPYTVGDRAIQDAINAPLPSNMGSTYGMRDDFGRIITTPVNPYATDTTGSFTGSGIFDVMDRAGKGTMLAPSSGISDMITPFGKGDIAPEFKIYNDRAPVTRQTPVLPFRNGVVGETDLGTTREFGGAMSLGSEGLEAKVFTNILDKTGVPPAPETVVQMSKAADPSYVPSTDMMKRMERNLRLGGGPVMQDSRFYTTPTTAEDYADYRAEKYPERILAVEDVPEEIDLREGPNYVPGVGYVEDLGRMGPFNTKPGSTFFRPKSENPVQDVTPTEEAEAAQAETVKEAKKARKGTGAVLNVVAPGLGTIVSGGLALADRQMQKLVDRYQNAGITERAEMERKYPNLIPRANQMGIPTGNDPDVANQIYREWANRTRMPAETRGGPSSNPPPAKPSGGGGAPATGGGGGTSGESSGGRPYIYYQWDLGVNIPSPSDSNYTLYQKYLAERAAAQAAMYG